MQRRTPGNHAARQLRRFHGSCAHNLLAKRRLRKAKMRISNQWLYFCIANWTRVYKTARDRSQSLPFIKYFAPIGMPSSSSGRCGNTRPTPITKPAAPIRLNDSQDYTGENRRWILAESCDMCHDTGAQFRATKWTPGSSLLTKQGEKK